MKRAWLTSLFAVCLGLSVASTWLLLNPVTVLAGSCKADCGDGHTVTCVGTFCVANDTSPGNPGGCTDGSVGGVSKSCSKSSDWDKPELLD